MQAGGGADVCSKFEPYRVSRANKRRHSKMAAKPVLSSSNTACYVTGKHADGGMQVADGTSRQAEGWTLQMDDSWAKIARCCLRHVLHSSRGLAELDERAEGMGEHGLLGERRTSFFTVGSISNSFFSSNVSASNRSTFPSRQVSIRISAFNTHRH